MATGFSGRDDNRPYKVVNYQGKTLSNGKKEKLDGIASYKEARELARKHNGVAVRA